MINSLLWSICLFGAFTLTGWIWFFPIFGWSHFAHLSAFFKYFVLLFLSKRLTVLPILGRNFVFSPKKFAKLTQTCISGFFPPFLIVFGSGIHSFLSYTSAATSRATQLENLHYIFIRISNFYRDINFCDICYRSTWGYFPRRWSAYTKMNRCKQLFASDGAKKLYTGRLIPLCFDIMKNPYT